MSDTERLEWLFRQNLVMLASKSTWANVKHYTTRAEMDADFEKKPNPPEPEQPIPFP